MSMPTAGIEPAVPSSDRSQTLAFDRPATGITGRKVDFENVPAHVIVNAV
jgi:hypothetical protein